MPLKAKYFKKYTFYSFNFCVLISLLEKDDLSEIMTKKKLEQHSSRHKTTKLSVIPSYHTQYFLAKKIFWLIVLSLQQSIFLCGKIVVLLLLYSSAKREREMEKEREVPSTRQDTKPRPLDHQACSLLLCHSYCSKLYENLINKI